MDAKVAVAKEADVASPPVETVGRCSMHRLGVSLPHQL